MPHPAGDRGSQLLLQPPGDEQVGRRSGAAVQVLVAAAHGQVGARAIQVHLDHARAVAEVPERPDARGAGRRIDRGHVVDLAGAIVGVGEQNDADVGTQRTGQVFARDLPDCSRRLGDIEVGGEVSLHGQHRAPIRPRRERGGQQLEEVHRGGIRDDHLRGPGPDQRRDLGPYPRRRIDPAPPGPGGHQIPAPLRPHDFRQPRRGGAGRRAQGIAGQVDHPLGQGEGVPEPGQGI